MQYDKELIAHKLDRWDRFITDYHLPEWDAIPDLGLYMDQVVVLLAQYLNFIPAMPGGKESFVTSSTINNYVRLKIMPAPVKRKYFRVHIAYLIMILTMKQSISISDVQKIIPADIPEEDVRAIYQEYSEKFRHIALFFNQQVQDAAEDIRTPDQPGEAAVSRLVIESTLIAGFSKILAEKLIRLCGADTQAKLLSPLARVFLRWLKDALMILNISFSSSTSTTGFSYRLSDITELPTFGCGMKQLGGTFTTISGCE